MDEGEGRSSYSAAEAENAAFSLNHYPYLGVAPESTTTDDRTHPPAFAGGSSLRSVC